MPIAATSAVAFSGAGLVLGQHRVQHIHLGLHGLHIDFVGIQLRLGDGEPSFGLVGLLQGGGAGGGQAGVPVLVLGGELLMCGIAFQRGLGGRDFRLPQGERCLVIGHGRQRAIQRVLVIARVYHREELAGFHRLVLQHCHLGDIAAAR